MMHEIDEIKINGLEDLIRNWLNNTFKIRNNILLNSFVFLKVIPSIMFIIKSYNSS
jgi:hypothetical protein